MLPGYASWAGRSTEKSPSLEGGKEMGIVKLGYPGKSEGGCSWGLEQTGVGGWSVGLGVSCKAMEWTV